MLEQRSGSVPQIDVRVAPKEEADNLSLLNKALSDLQRYENHFASALHLFDYCYIQLSVMRPTVSDAFQSWMLVAARDAVMSMWHFRKVLDAANSFANQSPYVAPQLDRTALGEAHTKFDGYFPEFVPMRHAVAHAGELAKNKKAYELNAFSGDYEGRGLKITNSTNVIVQDTLQDRMYTCTHEGKIVHCEISGATVIRLRDVMHTFYKGFTNGPPKASQPASAD